MPDKCILTIEDDKVQRTLIKRTLEKKHYRVITAQDGEEGLILAQEEHPDLILLDVSLPGMNGKEVCRQLKASLQTQMIPILFLTAMDSPVNVIDQYDLGAELHLTKPIKPKELIDEIEYTLQEYADDKDED